MTMSMKRDHIIEILYINYNVIKNNLFPVLTLLLGLVGADHFYENALKTGFIVAAAAMIMYSLLSWYCRTFSFDSYRIILREGVFTKRNQEISINRVKSIHTSDSYFKKIFGLSNFHVELIGGKEVSFVLTNKSVSEIKTAIFNDFHEEEMAVPESKFTFFQCMLLASTSFSAFLAALSITLTIASLLLARMRNWFGVEEPFQEQGMFIEALNSLRDTPMDVWLTLLAFMAGLFIVAFMISSLYMNLTYRNLHINRSAHYIHISYGLFAKKKYQIPVKEIRSVRIIQPLWFQGFNYVQIKIDYLGMDQRASSEFFIHPVLKEDRLTEFMERYLPFLKNEEITEKANLTVLPDYLAKAVWKPAFIISVFAYWYPVLWYASLLFPLFLFSGFLQWRYAGLSFNDRYVVHSRYQRMQVTKMITLKKYIQHTGISQSPVSEERNIATYRYSVYSGRAGESYKCYGLASRYKKHFLQYL